MPDLFGHTPPPADDGASELERRRAKRRLADRPRGYAATPGSGPINETCKSCAHAYAVRWAKTYYKCALVKATKGPGTDIRVRSPACSRWEKANA